MFRELLYQMFSGLKPTVLQKAWHFWEPRDPTLLGWS